MNALRAASCRAMVSLVRVKYDTVIGIIGKTHGVSSESAPITAASQRKSGSEGVVVPPNGDDGAGGWAGTFSVTGAAWTSTGGVTTGSGSTVPAAAAVTVIGEATTSLVGGRQ